MLEDLSHNWILCRIGRIVFKRKVNSLSLIEHREVFKLVSNSAISTIVFCFIFCVRFPGITKEDGEGEEASQVFALSFHCLMFPYAWVCFSLAHTYTHIHMVGHSYAGGIGVGGVGLN